MLFFRLSRVAAFCIVALAATASHAQVFRWAAQGDFQTADPHAHNESQTHMTLANVYESLVRRDDQLNLVPALATDWTQTGPLQWRFNLRKGVKFHDGRPFVADDVEFSVKRAQDPNSPLRTHAFALGTPKVIDTHTVEFNLTTPNPIFLSNLNNIVMMSKSWTIENKSEKAQNMKVKDEKHTTFNTNGTGAFIMTSRKPDVRTEFKRNPAWWDKFNGNLQEVVFMPVKGDSTRSAALLSGGVDFVLDPTPQDISRLRTNNITKVLDGPENRVIFLGMDQARDELLYSSVKGKNPFKDVRVRRALAHAIDTDLIKTRLMRGLAQPTGSMTPSPLGSFNDPEIEKPNEFNRAKARALMDEAGYGDGFDITLDCPNNRYVNDEEICQALAVMLAHINVRVKVNAMPRVQFFAKTDKRDTSMFLYGWGGSIVDADSVMSPVMHSRVEGAPFGSNNIGGHKNEKLDAMIMLTRTEPDTRKRENYIRAALKEHRDQMHHIPLHRQFIPWGMRSSVSVKHRPDNYLQWWNIQVQ